MRTELTYIYNPDELKNRLAYALIVESVGSSKWKTQSVQRKLKEDFTKEEFSQIHTIYVRCYNWYNRGINFDREVRITAEQHSVWLKLKNFCIKNFTVYGQNK